MLPAMKTSSARRRPSPADRQLFLGRLLDRKHRIGGPEYTVPQLLAMLNEHFSQAPYSLEKEFVEKTLRRDLTTIGALWDAAEGTWKFTHKAALSEMKTDLLFSNQNSLALMMAHKAVGQFKGTPLHGLLEPVFTRMLAQLPAEDRVYQNLLDRIRFTAPERQPIADKIWRTLCDAINDGTTLDMTYQTGFGGKAPKWRKVDPYALLAIGRDWHLLAFDHDQKAVRVFMVLRISEASDTNDRFDPQRGFSLDAYLADTVLGYPTTDGDKYQVKLRFTPEGSFAGRTTVWHPKEKRTQDKQGRLCVAFETSALFFVAREVLSWGGQVEVLEPADLRQQVAKMAESLLKGHA